GLDAPLVDRHGRECSLPSQRSALTAPPRLTHTSLPPTSTASTMPQITASTGFSRDISVMRAEEPCATSTSSPVPAPTASAATTWFPVGLKFPSTSRTSSSLSESRCESFRVETTVPSTSARITAALLLRRRSGRADREHVFQHRVRPRNDVDRDHLADLGSCSCARFGGCAHRRHVAAHDGGDIAAADLLVVHELDPRGLHHRVRGLDHRHPAACLDQSQGFFVHASLLAERISTCGASGTRPAPRESLPSGCPAQGSRATPGAPPRAQRRSHRARPPPRPRRRRRAQRP